MHYKDGTEAKLGDIIQHDNGSIGILIGGVIGNDYCSSHVVSFQPVKGPYGPAIGQGYIGQLCNEKYEVLKTGAVVVKLETAAQTREHIKIGHVDIGHG